MLTPNSLHTLSSAYYQCSSSAHRLATYHGSHKTTSFVSNRPHSSARTGAPAHDTLHCQVALSSGRLLGSDWGRRPSTWSSPCSLDRPASSPHRSGPRQSLERLSVLNLESLEVRRLKTDLVTCFKILKGFTSITPTEFLRATAYMLSAHMLSQFRPSVRLSVCPSVCPSVRHTGGSVKNG